MGYDEDWNTRGDLLRGLEDIDYEIENITKFCAEISKIVRNFTDIGFEDFTESDRTVVETNMDNILYSIEKMRSDLDRLP